VGAFPRTKTALGALRFFLRTKSDSRDQFCTICTLVQLGVAFIGATECVTYCDSVSGRIKPFVMTSLLV